MTQENTLIQIKTETSENTNAAIALMYILAGISFLISFIIMINLNGQTNGHNYSMPNDYLLMGWISDLFMTVAVVLIIIATIMIVINKKNKSKQ